VIVDMSHWLAFHIQPVLDGEEVHDVVAGFFPEQPEVAEHGWLKRWINPPALGKPAEFETVAGLVQWRFRENTPTEIVAEWMDSDP
jgi:hypothetical protein